MQMRSWAVWCFTVIGLCALANPAWAAPKKKKRAKAAETAEPVDVKEPAAAVSDEPKDIDSLMDDAKSRPAPVKKEAAAEPAADPDKPLYNDEANTASAWERPPAEAEKPKKKKKNEQGEIVSAPTGDGNNMNIGILAGYGLALGSGLTSLNPYGLGVGLVGEYEMENHLVLGIGGEYFLGERDPNATNNNGVRIPANANYILGHVNVGYNLWLSNNLMLRGTIWAGVAVGFVTKTPPHLTGLVVTALLGPGVSLHYLLGPAGWYLGGDIRLSIPVGQANSTKTGLPVMFTFGKRF
jgi:hypothetical protein